MAVKDELLKRSESKCELCSNESNLMVYGIPPAPKDTVDGTILVCETCNTQLNDPEQQDANHWRCLNDSMWSQVPGVQVVAWRMLHRLKAEGWSADLIDMMYMEDETLAWARESGDHLDPETIEKHRDVNGVELLSGDSVVLIKDLPVKGSSLVAKRGTAVRNITLDHDNPEYIEGKVEGQRIVIITKYVKKS